MRRPKEGSNLDDRQPEKFERLRTGISGAGTNAGVALPLAQTSVRIEQAHL